MADNFKSDLAQRYWDYVKSQFSNDQRLFDRPFAPHGRPPVFLPRESWQNIIIKPESCQPEIDKLLALVPDGEKHKWYRSMNSSQALAQSIMGNLAIHNGLHILSDLKDDDGIDLFDKSEISSNNFAMEYKVNYLGEPRSTSLDCYFSGEYRIAVECKYTEADIGTCSRPRLTPHASNYDADHCDGTYSRQRCRKERCSLTEIGVLYWQYIPSLFKWENDGDIFPCPLKGTYQLVRNILAAGVKPDGTVSEKNGHVVMIFDDRNPAFQTGGNGLNAYTMTRNALREPRMLRKCSWQQIARHIRAREMLPWLTENLSRKYGI